MKKILFLLSFMLMFPLITSAHTTVSVSTPSPDQVITEDLREVTVEFAGEIENQGDLTLVNEKQEKIEIDALSIEGKKISGTLPSPLENGSYTLTWKAVAKDGHLLTGQIPFTVSMPESTNNDKEEVKQEAGTEAANNNNQEKTIKEETDLEDKTETETAADNQSLIPTISIIVLIILLALGIFTIFRKKR